MGFQSDELNTISYVTANLENAAAQWAELCGAGPFYEFNTPSDVWLHGERVESHFRAGGGFMGHVMIELMQPVGDGPSLFTDVLREKGEGAMHHITAKMKVAAGEDYRALCKGYEDQGLKKVMGFAVPGGGEGSFYDARDRIGCYIEIVENSGQLFDLVNIMYDEHRNGTEGPSLRPVDDLFVRAGIGVS